MAYIVLCHRTNIRCHISNIYGDRTENEPVDFAVVVDFNFDFDFSVSRSETTKFYNRDEKVSIKYMTRVACVKKTRDKNPARVCAESPSSNFEILIEIQEDLERVDWWVKFSCNRN